MARISYDQLPPDGPKFPRDISRIANQAMQGKQNCVLDIEIPAGGLDSGTFRVFDVRISQQKWIDFVPSSLAGILLADDLFISELGNGFMDLSVVPQEFQGSACQIREENGSMGSLIAAPQIPFSQTDIEINFTVDLGANTITVLTDGINEISFTISGVYGTGGDDFVFGIRVIAGPNIGAEFAVATSTAGGGQGNNTVSISGAVLAQTKDGDVLEFFGDATGAGNFDPYILVWSMTSQGAFPLQPGAGPFNFRALIIG